MAFNGNDMGIMKSLSYNRGLAVVCFMFTCGIVLMAAATNWPVYKSMKILENVKEKRISGLMAVQNASILARNAVLLIESSAASGSDLDLIKAVHLRKQILEQISIARHIVDSPEMEKELVNLRRITFDIFSSGSQWVDAIIQLDLGAITPALYAFDVEKSRYEALISRLQQSSKEDLNNVLTNVIGTFQTTIYFAVLVSLITIPLIIMLQVKLSLDNAKLYTDLEETVAEKTKTLATIEGQNRKLSQAKIDNEKIMADLLNEVEVRQKAEKGLKASERQLNQIIDFLPDATFVIDNHGKVIAWNRAMAALTGVATQSILGKGDYEYALPFCGQRRPVMIDLVSTWDEKTAGRYLNMKKVGEVLISETKNPPFKMGGTYFLNSAGPLYGDDGSIVGAIETMRDISDRRAMEQALQERESILSLYMAYTPAAVAMCDRHMRYLAYSKRWITDYNLADEELIGRCHYDVFGDIPEEWKREHERCFRGEIIDKEDEIFTRKDGSDEWVKRMVHPWYTEEGDIGGLIMFTEVISKRKRMEIEREKLLAKLEARNAELERFTYTVSHDLKSPVITIKGFLGFIEMNAAQGDMESVREDLLRVANAADQMTQLLDELLGLSRIGRVVNPPEAFSWRALIEEILSTLPGELTPAGGQMHIVGKDEVLQGDRVRIREVFENLINNAIKFTRIKEGPSIELGCIKKEKEFLFYVKDNGMGIEGEYHDKIFGLFERLDPTVDGTGIGLAIVKRIVEVHGGRIWVESKGKEMGSTFFFTLPKIGSVDVKGDTQ